MPPDSAAHERVSDAVLISKARLIRGTARKAAYDLLIGRASTRYASDLLCECANIIDQLLIEQERRALDKKETPHD